MISRVAYRIRVYGDWKLDLPLLCKYFTGTFISSERRIELVEKLIEPPGEVKPDYEISWLTARAMGFEKEFPYSSPQEVFEEWKGLTIGRICDMGGVTYERLRGNGPPTSMS